ncbi:sensor histidine kinase [Neobacillus niacini]|uniref:sensor histidine kinase n=1 Tax=Neobacillus niacini TaxID=86668 RepID=UPI0021CB121E|nr:histidine kinase [Neobacillus niacini]MCM3766088.1 histidine kinase [Neobacillus niacini]
MLFVFSEWKLHWKFLFIFIILIILPMLCFSLYIYSQANKAVQLQAVHNMKSHLEKIDQNISAVAFDIEDISSYMIYSKDIRDFLNTPNIPENRTRLNELENHFKGFATFHLTSKMYLNSISLESNDGNQIDIGIPLGKNNEETWNRNAIQLRGKIYWSGVYRIQDYWGREYKVLSLYRVINDINDFTTPLGTVTIRLDADKLYQLIDIDFRKYGEIFVLNQNGTVLLHPDSNYMGSSYPDPMIKTEVQKNHVQPEIFDYSKNGVEYKVITEPVEGTDFVVVGMVNESTVAEGIIPIQDSIRIMTIVLTMLGVIALLGFYHFHIKRIQDLAKQTQQVENGNFLARVDVKSKDEIGLLGLQFNKMVERVRNLIENEYQMVIRNRESELKLLQSQINPHFLYNTLDMIRWTARFEKAIETSKLIELLSKMFRISLNQGKPWVSLRDELTYSQSYLELQKRRLGGKLHCIVYYDYEVLEAVVLKQIIQPLIENSITHGFEIRRSNCEIYIRCYRENQHLVIDVMDNGKGFPTNDFSSFIQKGYALQNIQERLNLAFGDNGSITIKEKDSPGAWLRIVHPYIESTVEGEVSKKEGDPHKTKVVNR